MCYNLMMKKNNYLKTAQDSEELFKLIMKLYWSYISNLEEYIQHVPETDVGQFNLLNDHMKEVQSSLEHDISIFEEAISNDTKDVHQTQDQLEINKIYQNLK